MFTLFDVYLSDRLEQLLESHPEYASILHDLLKRFKKARYLGSDHFGMIARYDTEIGRIVFEGFRNMSLLYFEDENISEIREAQEKLHNS